MTLGTGERKKVAILCALGALALYFLYTNVLATPDGGTAPAPRAAHVPREPALKRASARSKAPAVRPTSKAIRGRREEFHPVLRSSRAEDQVDPTTIDPTLRLDLLARLQNEEPAGGSRNLFQFGPSPQAKVELPKGPEPVIVPAPAKPVEIATEAPLPPIKFKYYGYSAACENCKKTAFFMDGTDIMLAGEGGTVKRRYRVIRIGATSVILEDVESKRQQPLALAEQAGG
jgi:hypothetical protein